MLDNLKVRRLNLLWEALQHGDGRIVQLDGVPAHNVGYTDNRVLNFDIYQLESDEAVVEETEHPSANLPGVTPYYVTDKGLQMLQEAGLAVDL